MQLTNEAGVEGQPYMFLNYFLVFSEKPIRVIIGALAATSFGACLKIASIDKLDAQCCLKLAPHWFSMAILPLAIISIGVWPINKIQPFFYKMWILIFFCSVLAFLVGVFYVIESFEWRATKFSFIASGIVIIQILSMGFHNKRTSPNE